MLTPLDPSSDFFMKMSLNFAFMTTWFKKDETNTTPHQWTLDELTIVVQL